MTMTQGSVDVLLIIKMPTMMALVIPYKVLTFAVHPMIMSRMIWIAMILTPLSTRMQQSSVMASTMTVIPSGMNSIRIFRMHKPTISMPIMMDLAIHRILLYYAL